MVTPPKEFRSFESLVQIVKDLRDPGHGCPWDLEQTHFTLTKHMIEEAHELVEAIEATKPLENSGQVPAGSYNHMIEELGDVLLQVVLHSELARQSGKFDLMDVIEALNKKLVYRHSHVFSNAKAGSAGEALANWEAQKAAEKAARGADASNARGFGVPMDLPALQRAQKIGEKTEKYNFDWENIGDVFKKVQEEVGELSEALSGGNSKEIEHELGDALFSLAQIARHADLDAEASLREGNRRFEARFFKMKSLADQRGLALKELHVAELEKLWQEAKRL